MTCPKCGGESLGVRYTTKNTDFIERSKECRTCHYQFSTIEIESDLFKSIIESSNTMSDKMTRDKTESTKEVVFRKTPKKSICQY